MDSTRESFEEVVDVEAIDSSYASSPSCSSEPVSTSSGAHSHGSARVRRKPIPKKGHTKSRLGCLVCKKRKVKCPENLPECDSCKRLGLKCVYPSSASSASSTLASSEPSAPAPAAPLRTTPGTFTMDDMRYFHHFLTVAYPPLPMEGDAVWKGVAALSHKYDYLIHAMLGLAASHLGLYTGAESQNAIAHRVKAIAGLNESLGRPCSSPAEGDARFGTIMALTFQASCMPEGMMEFLSMTRGCNIIASTGVIDFSKSLFRDFTAEGYTESVRRLIGSDGLSLDSHQAKSFDDFLVSLRNLGPLCSSTLEVKFLAATERVMKQSRFSAVNAFFEFTKLYRLITNAGSEEVGSFLDPNNYVAQLILIHFFFIEFAVGEMSLGHLGERFGFRRRSALSWLNGLLERLPEEYQSYAEWPLKHARVMAAGLDSPFTLSRIHPAMPQFLTPRPALTFT